LAPRAASAPQDAGARQEAEQGQDHLHQPEGAVVSEWVLSACVSGCSDPPPDVATRSSCVCPPCACVQR
jgi:hypothetical protein